VRVALWRALHLLVDAPPHVFEDALGLMLAAPDEQWQARPDMHPQGTAPFRASILARARFIEDIVADEATRGVTQYVILGAGLDTFVHRKSELASRLEVFEVDQPGTQAWKRRRLNDLQLDTPDTLHFVPINFEQDDRWVEALAQAGFQTQRPAVVSMLGVSMYLTQDAIVEMLRQAAALASGSTFVMSFLLPIRLADPDMQPWLQRAVDGAKASHTPFISFFPPGDMLALARAAGFKNVAHISAADLGRRYFANRSDGLRPPNNSEELLIART
jgi:methyltransferase (TIGR00027 family)